MKQMKLQLNILLIISVLEHVSKFVAKCFSFRIETKLFFTDLGPLVSDSNEKPNLSHQLLIPLFRQDGKLFN